MTPRLSLRRPAPHDIDSILEICGDPQPFVTTVTNHVQAQHLFDEWDEHWRSHGYGYWVVRYRDAAAPLGFCGIRSINMPAGPALNLYYRVAPACWGHGIATEAATAVVAWSRARLPDLAVIARIQPGNTASQRVALHAGLAHAEHLDTDSWIHYCDPRD